MSDGIEEIDLGDLAPKKLARVSIGGRKYVLNEASEAAVSAFKNAHQRAVQFADDGKHAGFSGAAEADAGLLAACLKDAETGRPGFTAEQVSQWPSSKVRPLVEKVQRGSGMLPATQQGGGEEAAEKNEAPPASTTGTSA